jgi:hypothetical protein
MISQNIAVPVLFAPPSRGADSLRILSGYATPNMASWYIKSLQERNSNPISISLLIGMPPYDGLSISVHEGFKSLHGHSYPNAVTSFSCSYIGENPPVHANLYIWMRGSTPVEAFTGSADFVQNAFVSSRCELLESCNPDDACAYYEAAEKRSIYCNHAEVEDSIVLRPTHQILDAENNPLTTLTGEGITSVCLSLLTNKDDVGTRSGLNWGQRNYRNHNEAYIPLPQAVAAQNFFPLDRHFTVVTDDRHTLILRVEQQNNKAITTPLSNAQLGEYFRQRLHLSNGAFVTKKDLINYGRTDVTFYKIDEEQFFMDFSPHPTV